MSKYPFPNPEAKGVGTNWIDTITRTALYQNYDLSISGASAKAPTTPRPDSTKRRESSTTAG